MATFAYRSPNSGFLFVYLVILVATVMAIQQLGPAPIVAVYILPWILALFYRRYVWLLMLWPAFLPVLAIATELTAEVGGIMFLPLDPVYFLSLGCLAIGALHRSGDLIKALKENIYLSVFLLIVVAYIILFTPLYGKSAIGEGRKVYFYFLFPVLTVFFVKTMRDLHNILLAFIFAVICLMIISYGRLGMGAPLRELANASAALSLLFIVLTIPVFHLNKEVLINRTIDLMILGLSLPIILMTQHRTVFMTGSLGLCLLLWLYRHRMVIFIKAATAVLAFLTLFGVVITAVPKFERYTIEKVSGIINPTSDVTASWRIKGWQQQLARLSGTSLVFGEGLGSYYYWRDERGIGVRVEPHNAYVQLVLKIGLLGLVVYTLIVVKFFSMTLSARKNLSLGRTRAYVEVGIVNYGAAHAYIVGYGFDLAMLIFFALAIGTVSLLKYSREAMQPV